VICIIGVDAYHVSCIKIKIGFTSLIVLLVFIPIYICVGGGSMESPCRTSVHISCKHNSLFDRPLLMKLQSFSIQPEDVFEGR